VAKYGNAVYGASKYGEATRLGYSVAPMSINVIDFSKVLISWQQPSGTFSKFRLVRNQSGFPETAEDGFVIFEQGSTDGSSIEGQVSQLTFLDGEENPDQVPIVSGSQIYYRVFLFTENKIWVTAGSITDIVPFNTGATERTLNILPRVLTSDELSPLGVVNPASELYQFLDAVAFTYEQMSTELTLLRPSHNRDKSLYSTIPAESLNLGLNVEANLPIVNQHRLVREAIYLYSNRGTQLGLEGYAEALTGYVPTATISKNLLLSIQDSTFYNSLGNWIFTNATAAASNEQVPATGTKVIDNVYSCKVTATGAFTMKLGEAYPTTQGVPVTASTAYIASFKVKSPPSSGNVTLTIKWYDGAGTYISSTSGSAVSANNTWKTGNATATSPANAVYASLQIASNASGQYYIDQVCMQLGNTVAYDEARAITLELGANKVNYIQNPSFEVNSSTWTVTGATFSQDSSTPFDGYSGNYSGKFVAASTWSIEGNYNIPVEPGFYFTFSGYVKATSNKTITIYADLYDIEDNLLGSESTQFNATTSWSRFSLSKLITSTSTESYTRVRIAAPAGTFYLDMFQFEDSYKASDYFDGSMPSQYGAIWAGTANASNTYLYPGKLTKIPRLANTLTDWVPMNSWWRVQTPVEVEYTNLQV
jgi:hypothetical protein